MLLVLDLRLVMCKPFFCNLYISYDVQNMKMSICIRIQGGDSQNFLQKFVRFFVTLGLKILRLFRLKVLYEADIIKG